jgi:hypothetical protein
VFARFGLGLMSRFAIVLGLITALLVAQGQPATAALQLAASAQVSLLTTASSCPTNDVLDSIPAAGDDRCLAGWMINTRARLTPACLVGPNALRPITEYYRRGECNNRTATLEAEAIAQARLIAKLNQESVKGHSSTTGITADIQWETQYTDSAGTVRRPDVMVYDHTQANAKPELIELRGVWDADYPTVQAKLTQYVDTFPGGVAKPHVFPSLYEDAFTLKQYDCPNGQPPATISYRAFSDLRPGIVTVAITRSTRCKAEEPQSPPVYFPPPVENAHPEVDICTLLADDCGDLALKGAVVVSTLVAVGFLIVVAPEVTIPVVVGSAELIDIDAELAALLDGVSLDALGVAAKEELARMSAFIPFLFSPNVYGDPHIATLDGRSYDLQAVGEFHLIEAPDYGVDVQARFKPFPGSTQVSGLAEVSFKVGADTVQIASASDVQVNGVSKVIPANSFLALPDGGGLVSSGGRLMVVWPGVGLRPRLYWQGGSIAMWLPPGAHTKGLLGNNDGDPLNDLAMSDGTAIPAGSSASVIYGRFADSWRVTDADSSFSYGVGQSTATFTDKTFPSNVLTIGDFSEAEIAAASVVCADAGVVPGPQFEDCVFDVALTGDNKYADAAALVTDVLVDPNAHTFDASGILSEDFEGTVGSNFAASRYSQDASTTRVAGPLFDTPGYRMFARDVPRHDWTNIQMDVLTYGPVGSDSVNQSLGVEVDGKSVGNVAFDGVEPQFVGDAVGSISRIAVGQTAGGTPFSRYRLTMRIQHASPSLDVELVPSGFRGLLNTSLGVDNVLMTLEAPPSEEFHVALPLSIPSDTALIGTGAGSLGTPGSEDAYFFELTQPAPRGLLIDHAQCGVGLSYTLENVSTNTRVVRRTCGDYLTEPLPQGNYVLRVTGASGDYALKLMVAPDPQSFAYAVGDAVSNGVPGVGAGNLETIASKDVFTFTVPAGGQQVAFDGSGYASVLWWGSSLIQVATGTNLGKVNDHHVFNLAAGDYRIEVEWPGGGGTYWFSSYGIAGPPSAVVATASDASAAVSWAAPASNGGSVITGYTVTASPGGLSATTTGATSAMVSGLTNGTAYTFTVTAANAAGSSPESSPSTAVTPSAVTVPGAPTTVTTTPGNAQAVVAWTAPASNGGSAITGYTVTASPGGLSATTIIATSATISGLTNGTAYTFTVTAANAAGTSPASLASSAVTPRTVPGSPTAAVAAAGIASAVVSWTAPASNGGSAITGYTVTASPGGLSASTTGATSATVAGLTNGTAYTFTVTAANAAGTSPPSLPSSAVTPAATAPNAPTIGTATAANASAVVTWTAPASNGGSVVTGYTVTASPGGLSATTTGAINATVAGLTNGTAYTFTVTAANAVGTSPASAASAAVTPRTVPGAPTGPVAAAGNASAVVSWTAPASNGGSAVTGYTVAASPGGLSASTTGATSATVSGLTNGTAYTFTVTAASAAGSSPASLASAGVTPRTVPGAPTGAVAAAGNASAVVSWTAPASNGGAAITGYTVQVINAATSVQVGALRPAAAGATNVTVTSLVNGTAVKFQVLATNIAGSSPYSALSNAVTPAVTATVTRLSDFNKDGFTDMVARDNTGVLWLYPGNGAGGLLSRVQMATGWGAFTAIVTPGDVTGDGNADVLARDTAGVLWLYPGSGASALSARRQISTGWNGFTITNSANLNGTGGPDLLARDSAGVLWLYPFSGNAVLGTRTQIATGWSAMTSILGPGDVSGDGRADILARDAAGSLWLYRGNGTGGVAAGTLVSSGWQAMAALVTPGNWNRAVGNDLLTQDASGTLWLYPGDNAGGFGTPLAIGSGWSAMTYIG